MLLRPLLLAGLRRGPLTIARLLIRSPPLFPLPQKITTRCEIKGENSRSSTSTTLAPALSHQDCFRSACGNRAAICLAHVFAGQDGFHVEASLSRAFLLLQTIGLAHCDEVIAYGDPRYRTGD